MLAMAPGLAAVWLALAASQRLLRPLCGGLLRSASDLASRCTTACRAPAGGTFIGSIDCRNTAACSPAAARFSPPRVWAICSRDVPAETRDVPHSQARTLAQHVRLRIRANGEADRLPRV